VLVTPLAGAAGRLIVRDAGEVTGTLDDPTLQTAAAERARRRLGAPRPASGPETVGTAELFFEMAEPPPALVVFGAGHDAAPVARFAWTLGFVVTMVDPREAFLTADRFPGAALVGAHVDEFAARVTIRPGSFVLVMNHHVERDREALRFAFASPAGWIGVLGPRARYEKLLAELAADGVTPDAASLARVRSPVGLALGAETPEEVAVSVLAEILATRRGFAGGVLDGSVGSLHRPDESRLLTRS